LAALDPSPKDTGDEDENLCLAIRIVEMSDMGEQEIRRIESRLEALELELERAHRLLDEFGVPREFREEGERDPMEYSLDGRIRLILEDEDA
jgi:hypothetical protein